MLLMYPVILLLLSYFLHKRHYFHLISHFWMVTGLTAQTDSTGFFPTLSKFLKNAFESD